MAFTAQDFEDGMSQLLPQGQVWEQFREQVHVLLRALSQEPARLAADAALALEAAIPDNANTDLDAFERVVGPPDTDLTDAERLARIQSLLFGRRHVSLSYLQDLVRVMAGDPGVTLLNRAYAPAAVGELNVGDSLAAGVWDATWLCEYMKNALGYVTAVTPDDFDSWTGFLSVVSASQQSPVTEGTTAARVSVPADPSRAYINISPLIVAADLTAYLSIWVRPVSGTGHLTIEYKDREGGVTSTSYVLELGIWHKLILEAPAGGDLSAQPRFQLYTNSVSAQTFDVSYAVAGARDSALEARIKALFQIHTFGDFAIQGEFDVSLAQDPQYEEIL